MYTPAFSHLSYFGYLEVLLPNQEKVFLPYTVCPFGFHQTEPMLLMFLNWSCMEMLLVCGWGEQGREAEPEGCDDPSGWLLAHTQYSLQPGHVHGPCSEA